MSVMKFSSIVCSHFEHQLEFENVLYSAYMHIKEMEILVYKHINIYRMLQQSTVIFIIDIKRSSSVLNFFVLGFLEITLSCVTMELHNENISYAPQPAYKYVN